MMDLVPQRPYREVDTLRREMDHMWDRFFGEVPFLGRPAREWMPAVDVSETDNHINVKAEVPGFDAKDIDVSVAGDMLTIKGEKREAAEKDEQHYYAREITSNSFQRAIVLPAGVKDDQVEAEFKNGILDITLPKSEESKTKRIEIK